ncbi:hypothetical protein [Flavobacterium sp.]|uniref:hypothetical protein n=1 Tax=Flavobacterium sp. TaxID=239 RepID=UPI00261FB71E|nr:hypothetical protein [Flavobacterium sp.]
MSSILLVYLLFHTPALVGIGVGFYLRKKNPDVSKALFILSGAYFIIGYGLCGRYML